MAYYDWGNVPLASTEGLQSNPSTATLVAELDSTAFATVSTRAVPYRVSWIVGASTLAVFQLEHALSTGLGSTGIRDQVIVLTPTNQSGQYMTTLKVENGDRLRVRLNSTFTGNAAAKIVAEPLT